MGKRNKYVSTIRAIYSKEGVLGFYSGWKPQLVGLSISTSLTFGMFDAFHSMW